MAWPDIVRTIDPVAMQNPTLKKSHYGLLISAFALSELTYHRVGVRFHADGLGATWQYLDPALMQTDLLRSVWFLHSQPPLFNLAVGAALKIAPTVLEQLLHAAYVASGLLLYVGLAMVMIRINVRPLWAVTGAMAFLISPSFVLYEHWFFYTFPIATMLVVSVLACSWFMARPTWKRSSAFCTTLLILCGTHAVYQLPYFVAVVGTLCVMQPRARRLLLLGATVPVACLCALYFKNSLLFGVPSTSSWAGMSLAKMTVAYIPEHERLSLIASGTLSPLALIDPFSPPSAYPPAYFDPGLFTAPALIEPLKSTGQPNMNHIGYVRLSREYLGDAVTAMRLAPGAFGKAIADAWRIYAWSSSNYRFLDDNRRFIAGWTDAFDRYVYGRVAQSGLYLGLRAGLLSSAAFALYAMWRWRARTDFSPALIALILLNITYLAVVGNSTELGENNRFRFATDGLTVALITLMLQTTHDHVIDVVGRASGRLEL